MRSKTASDSGTPPQQSSRHCAREQTLARGILVLLGAGYLIVQLVFFSIHRSPGWDEAVYLSQVMPGTKALFFAASRARGITLLVAPVTWLGGSVGTVRLFLVAVSAVAMVATFWLWIPLVGVAAPVATFVFSFSWIGLFYGSEVFPNFWAAILGLAMVGLIARRLEGGGTRHIVFASALLGAMALFRPTEAAVAAGAIGVYILLFRRGSWHVLVPLGIGLLLGCLPWLIEMSMRFGGPANALRLGGTAHFADVSIGQNVSSYVRFTIANGIYGSQARSIPPAGVIWWGMLIVMAIVAIARGRTATDRAVALLASLVALALASEYLFFVRALAPRFLLPAYALASLPIAIALVSLLRDKVALRAFGAIVLILMVPWTIWQGAVANRVEAHIRGATDPLNAVGVTIHQLAGGRPCAFVTPVLKPEIELAAGCDRTVESRARGPSQAGLAELQRGGEQVFVVLRSKARPGSPLGYLIPIQVSGNWFIYQVSG